MAEISVILPVYNGAAYLAQAIESVQKQTFEDWELIIVDDASSDNSADIAAAYAGVDTRIQVVKNPKNLKLPASLNVGFGRARGTFWTWTSHDNLYRPVALETLLAALKAQPRSILAASNYSMIDAAGVHGALVELCDITTLIAKNCVGACFLYRAEAARKAGPYRADRFLAEDYDYWLRLHALGPILQLADDLYLYRAHAGSLTETRQKQVRMMDARIKAEYLPTLEGLGPQIWFEAARKIIQFHPNFFVRARYLSLLVIKDPRGFYGLVAKALKRALPAKR